MYSILTQAWNLIFQQTVSWQNYKLQCKTSCSLDASRSKWQTHYCFCSKLCYLPLLVHWQLRPCPIMHPYAGSSSRQTVSYASAHLRSTSWKLTIKHLSKSFRRIKGKKTISIVPHNSIWSQNHTPWAWIPFNWWNLFFFRSADRIFIRDCREVDIDLGRFSRVQVENITQVRVHDLRVASDTDLIIKKAESVSIEGQVELATCTTEEQTGCHNQTWQRSEYQVKA